MEEVGEEDLANAEHVYRLHEISVAACWFGAFDKAFNACPTALDMEAPTAAAEAQGGEPARSRLFMKSVNSFNSRYVCAAPGCQHRCGGRTIIEACPQSRQEEEV